MSCPPAVSIPLTPSPGVSWVRSCTDDGPLRRWTGGPRLVSTAILQHATKMSALAVSHTGQVSRFHWSVMLYEPEPSAEGSETIASYSPRQYLSCAIEWPHCCQPAASNTFR